MKKTWKCSFCKRPHTKVWKIVVTEDAAICNTCVALTVQALLETPETETMGIIGGKISVDESPEAIAEFFAKKSFTADRCRVILYNNDKR